MKNFLFAALLFIFPYLLFAQRNTNVSNVVKTSVISPAFRTFSLAYERAFTGNISGQLNLSYLSLHIGRSANELNLTGYSICPEVRFYLNAGQAINGFFIAPYFKTQSYKMDSNYDISIADSILVGKSTIKSNGFGLIVGEQRVLMGRITFEYYLGTTFNNTKIDIEDQFKKTYYERFFNKFVELGFYNKIGLRAGVTVGIAF